jgi:hypothetical protein
MGPNLLSLAAICSLVASTTRYFFGWLALTFKQRTSSEPRSLNTDAIPKQQSAQNTPKDLHSYSTKAINLRM